LAFAPIRPAGPAVGCFGSPSERSPRSRVTDRSVVAPNASRSVLLGQSETRRPMTPRVWRDV